MDAPFPITSENFEESWRYVDAQRRTARKKARITKTAGFFSSVALAVCTIFCANGLILRHLEGVYCRHLQKLRWFIKLWQQVSDLLLKSEGSWQTEALILLAASCAVSLAVFSAVMLVILILYHPLRKKLPVNETRAEQAQQLVSLSQRAYWSAAQVKPHVSMGGLVFFYLAVACVILYFVLKVNNAEQMQEMMTTSLFTDYGLNVNLFIIGCCVLFIPVDYVRALLTGLLVHCTIPYTFVMEVQTFAVFAGKEHDGLTREVWMEQSRAVASQTQEQALELERIQAYRKAKELLLEAALCGDVPAMEHYARHCLLDHQDYAARCWLERCLDSGAASEDAKKMLRRLKWGRKHKVRYLH